MRGELLLRNNGGDRVAAEAAFRRAVEVAQRQGTPIFELRATLSLAQLYHTMGRHQTARDLLVPALRRFDDPVEVPEILHAQRLIGVASGPT
jgi:tetratricopeptide (TPR) repeat protein